MTRRLLLSAGGGASFHPPVAVNVSGPYSPVLTVNEAVITQVHCHTNQSDGSYSPATVVQNYLDRGVGALVLTDHDKATSQPAGITTAIIGNEHSATAQHIIAINADYLRGGVTDAQTIIDGIVADGGVAEVAHPKWLRGMTYAELVALTDYAGFEIHNAHCVDGAGQNPVTYPGFAVDLWDQTITGRLAAELSIPFGFSVDDIHVIGNYDAFDVGRLRVFVDDNDTSNIVSRISSGNFVADVSNYGVTPGFPARSDNGVSVSCTGATRVEAWGSSGLLAAANTNSLSYGFTGSEQYVRLVAWGDYSEAFGSDLDDRWRAVDGTWAVGSGTLNLTSDGTARRIILRRHREGDFTAQVKVKVGNGGLDQGSLMFNVLSNSYYYLIFFGQSSNAAYNNKLAIGKSTTGSPASTPLAATALTATADTWYTISMAYTASSGLMQAKAWADGDTEPVDWMVSASDTAWKHGAFGFRATYTTSYDDLYINGFKTYYQPIAVD